MALEITLDEIALPNHGIVGLEGCETEIRIVSPHIYPRLFPDLAAHKPAPKGETAAVVVIRQRVMSEWIETVHFIETRLGDLNLKGLIVGEPKR